MTLTRALAPAASPRTRARGAQYLSSGAVVHFDPQQSMAYAVVRGADDYVVRIEIAGQDIRCTCTCPYFSDHFEPCKHLWAVALTCDDRGVLQTARLDRPRGDRLRPCSARRAGLGPVEIDDPEFRTSRPRSASRGSTPHGARSSAWQQALTAITAAASQTSTAPALPPGQLLYVVDLAGSRQAGALLMHLLRQEQKQNGEWGVPKAARIITRQVPSLPDSDRTILERIAGARPAYAWNWSGVGTDVPSPFHMGGVLARDLLPVICATGRCRLALSEYPGTRPQDAVLTSLEWDAQPRECALDIVRDDAAGVYRITGTLKSVRARSSRSAMSACSSMRRLPSRKPARSRSNHPP